MNPCADCASWWTAAGWWLAASITLGALVANVWFYWQASRLVRESKELGARADAELQAARDALAEARELIEP